MRRLVRSGELVPYAPPLRTQLVVGAEVERAVVTVDGQPVELWQPVDVSAGGHDLVVEAPGYQRAERRVVVSAGTFLPVDVALSPRPGRLDVRAEAGAQLYAAAGTLSDWMYGEAGATSFTIELRPKGGSGFVLPPEQISPTCDEGLAAVLALGQDDLDLQRPTAHGLVQ